MKRTKLDVMAHSALGRLLVDKGLLTEIDRQTILDSCGASSGAFAKGILALGLLDDNELAEFIARHSHYAPLPKDFESRIPERPTELLKEPLIVFLEVVPLAVDGPFLEVAMLDPLDRAAV